jgi:hypothetical protein
VDVDCVERMVGLGGERNRIQRKHLNWRKRMIFNEMGFETKAIPTCHVAISCDYRKKHETASFIANPMK